MRAVQVSRQVSRFLTAALVLAASSAYAADDGAWTVSKSSGEVWLTSTGAQPASLKQEEFLKPGDTIRTGRTGRVLLKRGEESMMISPNSVIGVPAEKKEGLSTTIHAAGRFHPARGRKAQRQAFRGRDPLPCGRGEGHPVSRHRECVKHQRRRAPRPGRSGGFAHRSDRAGHARPACDDLLERQWRSFAQRQRQL